MESISLLKLPNLIHETIEKYGSGYLYDSAVLQIDGGIADEEILKWIRLMRENAWIFRDGCSVSEINDRIDRLEAGVFEGWTALTSAAFFLARYIAGHKSVVLDKEFEEFCQCLKPDTGVHELFAHLGEKIIQPALLSAESSERQEIIRAIGYMVQNLSGDISLKTVSAEVGLHPTYFSHLFKQEMGVGFSNFVGVLRIEQACMLLKRRSLSIQEISDLCGFSDVSYFCRKFKQVVGVSPSAWRTR